MIRFDIPSKDQMKLLTDIHAQKTWAQELIEAVNVDEPCELVSIGQLYSYATEIKKVDIELEEKIEKNINLRRIYRQIIEENAVYTLPEAMAASSLDFPYTRTPEDKEGPEQKVIKRIRVEVSRAEKNQVYVIFEFDEAVDLYPERTTIFLKDEAHVTR